MKKNNLKKKDKTAITLKDKLTINNVGEIYSEFTNALSKVKKTTITFSNITAIDISFIQLFCAFYRAAKEKNMQIEVDAPLKQEFHDYLIRTGFCTAGGERPECHEDCVQLLIRGNS